MMEYIVKIVDMLTMVDDEIHIDFWDFIDDNSKCNGNKRDSAVQSNKQHKR